MFSRQIRRILIPVANLRNINKSVATDTEPARLEKTINQVTILGRVGADPQRKGSAEHPVVIFSVATHSNYRYDTGDFQQRVEWHRVCVFKPGLRETIQNYLKKGQRVYVQGRLNYGEIKMEDGTPRPTTSIVADDVIFFQSNESKN